MDLEQVERITAGAVGEPGARTFYIQVRQADMLVTILVEKEQVQLLAASVLEVLSRLDVETGTDGPSEDEMVLEEPCEPIWRAGRISIGYEEGKDRLLLEMEQLLPEADDEDEEAEEADLVRVWATREQMLSLSRHGALVCQKGRPACELCGNPKDPEGHACPATNGHRKLGSD